MAPKNHRSDRVKLTIHLRAKDVLGWALHAVAMPHISFEETDVLEPVELMRRRFCRVSHGRNPK